ncbi:MAG: SAP domain-containing protein [Bacteroidota bacterium]
MPRPEFEMIKTSEEFSNWYWKKDELVQICKNAGLSISGSKFELRDRIIFALENNGKVPPKTAKAKVKSKFNWSKAELTLVF